MSKRGSLGSDAPSAVEVKVPVARSTATVDWMALPDVGRSGV